MKIRCLLIGLTFFSAVAPAQTPGPLFRHFFFNPYLFNPAFAAINERPEANLVYRQQWISFQDAPVTTGFSFQIPTSQRVALGLNVVSDKQLLIRNSSFLATFGYVVPFDEKQSLRFGLSGGASINKLDLDAEELNTNDPALFNAAGNSYFVDGNFGVVYVRNGLQLGFALTKLFKTDPFNQESSGKVSISSMRDRLFSAAYRFPLNKMNTVTLEPFLLYRQSDDSKQNAWELAALVHFKETFWTGAGYNQKNGTALYLGVNAKDKFRFSYSYELPPSGAQLSGVSSHELHLNVRFGRKKIKPTSAGMKTSDVPNAQVKETKVTVVNPQPVTQPEENKTLVTETHENLAIQKTDAKPSEVIPSPEENPKINEIDVIETIPSKPPVSLRLKPGHYVIAGVFSSPSSVTSYVKQLQDKGHSVNSALNPGNNLYYVYIFSTYNLQEAKEMCIQFKENTLFQKAWVFTVK